MILVEGIRVRLEQITGPLELSVALSADNQATGQYILERWVVGNNGGAQQIIGQSFTLDGGSNDISTMAEAAHVGFSDSNPDYVTLEFTNHSPITLTGAQLTLIRRACTDPIAENYDPLANHDNGTCLYSRRTGFVAYGTLEQYDRSSGSLTGVTKPNGSDDPDYVPPVEDSDFCGTPEVVPEPPQVNACPLTGDLSVSANTNEVTLSHSFHDSQPRPAGHRLILEDAILSRLIDIEVVNTQNDGQSQTAIDLISLLPPRVAFSQNSMFRFEAESPACDPFVGRFPHEAKYRLFLEDSSTESFPISTGQKGQRRFFTLAMNESFNKTNRIRFFGNTDEPGAIVSLYTRADEQSTWQLLRTGTDFTVDHIFPLATSQYFMFEFDHNNTSGPVRSVGGFIDPEGYFIGAVDINNPFFYKSFYARHEDDQPQGRDFRPAVDQILTDVWQSV